jgi:hypothetical protein
LIHIAYCEHITIYWNSEQAYALFSTVTLSEHLRSPSVFWWSPCCSSFLFLCVLSYYVSLRSVLCVVMSVTISPLKRCSVHLYLQLFVGGLMSYLRYTCLLACGGVLFVFVFCLVHHMLNFFWIFHFWLPLRYSLTFIYRSVYQTIVFCNVS